MSSNFDKIINLVKKTGDNCIVVDSAGNPQYVLVNFDKYQVMAENSAIPVKSTVAGLTENELLNKINNDIAEWKASVGQENLDFENLVKVMDKPVLTQDFPKSMPADDPFLEKKSLNLEKNNEDFSRPEEKYYFEPID